LGAGSHTINAVYGATDDFKGSTATLPQSVAQASTTTALSSSASAPVFGQSVTFTAQVSPVPPGAGAPGGTAVFVVDGVAQPAVAVVNGQATFTTSSLSVGTHTVSATYNGDANFTGSAAASLTLTVGKAATQTVLTSSANPSGRHEPITFTATVTAAAPGGGTPRGFVVFVVDRKIVGFVALNNGVATLTVPELSPGQHHVFALYLGNDDYLPSLANELTQIVDPPHHHHRHHHHHKPTG
jgi:hypothetical protein